MREHAFPASAEGEQEGYQGLYISQEEVLHSLAQESVSRLFHPIQLTSPTLSPRENNLVRLMHCFALSPFDMDILLLALAPELDLRYERIYAYLQDDIARKRPSVDLVLQLLCSSAQEKLARYRHFSPAGPLIQHGLLRLVPDVHQVDSPLLTHSIKVEEQVIRFLLGNTSFDPRLLPFCRCLPVSWQKEQQDRTRENTLTQALERLVLQARAEHRPVTLYFYGPRQTGQRERAEELAIWLDMPLLLVEVERLVTLDRALFEQALSLLLREARLQQALLFFDDVDVLTELATMRNTLLGSLASYEGETILCGTRPRLPGEYLSEHVIRIPFTLPNFTERKARWRETALAHSLELSTEDLDALAGSFRLTSDQITRAVDAVYHDRQWQEAQNPGVPRTQPQRSDLFLAASAQTGHELSALSRKAEISLAWDNLVLPPEQMAQLREFCDQARYRHVVYHEWGFAHKLPSGNGLSALFSGPPGTGKTMAAGIIAASLGLNLYTIDLARIVSKYIGETEKNLQAVFSAAEHSNAILFFDEADALFGKRSQVKDAHDRYANIEIGYLLQQMEEYDGIVLLATNLQANMDEAFLRRLRFSIEFPFPDESSRLRIWQDLLPAQAPRNADINFPFLAGQFKLAGGNIKNIVLNAAFLAAARHEPIGMRHIILAVHREYQKMGKMSLESDFGQYYGMINAYD